MKKKSITLIGLLTVTLAISIGSATRVDSVLPTMTPTIAQVFTLKTAHASELVEKPQGRISGIIHSGEHSQVMIEHGQERLRLRQGEQWHGWTITAIHQNEIEVAKGELTHKLALYASFAPTLSTAGRQAGESMQNLLAHAERVEKSTIPPLVLTEQQLTMVRNRLLAD